MERSLTKLLKTNARPGRRARGFTLIELMITVAIVAILASLAYPSYNRYLGRTYRAAAKGYMLQVSNLQQRYLLDQRGYAANLGALNLTVPSDISGNYTITTELKAGTTPPGFTVTAVPSTAQSNRDPNCGTLKVDEAGVKTPTPTGGGDSCW